MKFSTEEVKNLKRLLASDKQDSLSLGLAILEQNQALMSEEVLPILVWQKRYFEYNYDDYREEEEELELYDRLYNLHKGYPDAVLKEKLEQALSLFFDWTGSYWEIEWAEEREELEPLLKAFEAHRSDFEEYLLINRDFIEKYIYLGDNLRRMEQFETAFSFLKPAVDSGLSSMPGKIHYINCLVVGLLSENSPYLGEVPQIIRFLEEAIQAYPRYTHQYYTQIAMLNQVYLKNIKQALEYNYMSHKVDPEYPVNLNNLAWLQYQYEGKYEEAYQHATKAVELSKDEPQASYLNTLACLEMDYKKDLERAEQYFLKALVANPLHHHSILRLGDIYQLKANYTKAYEQYKKGLSIADVEQEDRIENLWKLATLCAEQLDLPAEAIAYCQKVLEIDGSHQAAAALKEALSRN